MKVCGCCKQEKDFTEFAWRNKAKETYQSQCNNCRHATYRKYYESNREKTIQKTLLRSAKLVQEFVKWKETLECEICGENERVCLDFHHLDSKSKLGNIGRIVTHSKRLKEELKKCICVCANCHRKIHKYGLDVVIQQNVSVV